MAMNWLYLALDSTGKCCGQLVLATNMLLACVVSYASCETSGKFDATS